VGGLRPEEVLGHSAAESRAESLAARALHENNQNNQHAHDEMNGDQDGQNDKHRELKIIDPLGSL